MDRDRRQPLYVDELLRGDVPVARVIAGLPAPHGLGLAQALAILGDGCELRQAAVLAGVDMDEAMRLAAELVRADVLATTDPLRFIHPVVRDAIEASMADDVEFSAPGGAQRTPAGDVPPTGRRVELDYLQVLRFRDGKHVSFNLMFDRLLMLEQLALVPAPARASRSA